MERHFKSVMVGNTELKFETGKVAKQANGAVILHADETMVMATACASKEPMTDVDFLPLRVDYQERFSSAGKSLGGFIKREGRPAEHEILTCRLIDRPIRPMFPEGYHHDVQIIASVISYDRKHSPDVLAICAASAALTISDIPLVKPLGAVRVGRIEGQLVINPSPDDQEKSDLDLVLAGTEDAVLMIEGYCDFLTEDQVMEAIETGHAAIKDICKCLAQLREEVGKPKQMDTLQLVPEEVSTKVTEISGPMLKEAMAIKDKKEREERLGAIKDSVLAEMFKEGEEPAYTQVQVEKAIKKANSDFLRAMVLSEKVRCDGRSTTDIRPIDVEHGLLPRTHGSALFTRGETQSMATCTLGGQSMGQRFENLDKDDTRKFYLQYFFPPYSVGEVGRLGPAGRREVGHGKLAERALASSMPSQSEFPYVVRVESNITECNGSSSMASVCGGCLAMMDAGVPLKRPVAGIAMGLILDGTQFAILSDILGIEDALGDMDFKVTGDQDGITAFQMDIKVEGITPDIMRAALAQAKDGRAHILSKMLAVLPQPKEMADHAPRIETLKVKPSKIATIIGPGGKQIRAIVEETGVEIDIDDDGIVSISSADRAGIEKAKTIIGRLTAEIEVGALYDGKVVSVVPFGCFVEVLPGKEGLCHISELSHERVEDINSHIKPGAPLQVKVLDINERGQLKLSHKATIAKEKVSKEKTKAAS